jgi:hypothetical protein
VRRLLCIFLVSAVSVAAQTTRSELTEQLVNAPEPSDQTITGKQRLQWIIKGTVGAKSLGTGFLSAGLGTARDKPPEYGTHWDGFTERYGMRLTGIAPERVMEAGLGDLWGEDPRYHRIEGQPWRGRVKHVLVSPFAIYSADGDISPAYARLISMPASNFLSNTWRPDSESSAAAAGRRTALGFVFRMAGNAFTEFWPDMKQHMFSRRK